MPCINNDNGQPVPGQKGFCPINSTWSESNMVNLVRSQEPRITQDYSIEDKKVYTDEKKEGAKFKKVEDVINKNKLNQTKSLPQLMSNMSSNFMTPNSQRRETFDAGINPMTGKKLPGAMTKMQKLGANMKNPEWWSESISGLPSDTRLMRLGQLMNYYGKTPKGRKDSDDPSKLWAANEAASAKIQAAKDAAANKTTKPTSVLSKLGGEELDAAIRPLVEKQLGYSDFIPFNQASSDEVDRDVALVKTLVQQYHTVDGMPINEAIDKAVKQVQNTNIPVLPFF